MIGRTLAFVIGFVAAIGCTKQPTDTIAEIIANSIRTYRQLGSVVDTAQARANEVKKADAQKP
jgi:hypothetical protein